MKLLFQGDSITDAGRNRTDMHNLGEGYPKYAAQFIKAAKPDKDIEFINLGISGNQTADLLARLTPDFTDIGADIVSVMIGINDTWHRTATREYLKDEIFESNYRTVLDAVKKTGAKILMLEPYLIPVPDKMFFYEDLFGKILICRKLAREYADAYIPLDGIFAAACIDKPSAYFSPDGVHPNAQGAEFIGKLYAEAVLPLLD